MGVINNQPVKISLKHPLSPARILGIRRIEQEKTQWCWAACLDMVLEYYRNPGPVQCDFAKWLFNPDCCQPQHGCNKPCNYSAVQRLYANWSINCQPREIEIGPDELITEINCSRPVEVGLRLSSGEGHLILVIGFESENSANSFIYVDPQSEGNQSAGYGTATYDELMNAFGMGNWECTWTDIR